MGPHIKELRVRVRVTVRLRVRVGVGVTVKHSSNWHSECLGL